MPYLDPALITDETSVAEAVLAAFADRLGTEDEPWEASEGHLEVAEAEAYAMVLATIAALIIAREREDYRGFGENVLGVIRDPAQPAMVPALFTLTDVAGGTISAGFEMVLATPDGEEHTFTLAADVVIAPGTQTGIGLAVAQEPGLDANGATGDDLDGAPLQVDELAIVEQVTVTATAEGGRDEQPLIDYNSEVVRRARRMRELPITPEDYAARMLDAPHAARAYAVNRRDPATGSADAPGHVTIHTVTAAGIPPTSEQLADQQAYLDELETVRGTVQHAAAAGVVPVTVAIEFEASTGSDTAAAQDAVEARVLASLNGRVWNLDEDAAGLWAPAGTDLHREEVSQYDVAAMVDDLPELVRVIGVQLNGGAGPIAVPATSVVSATVTATAA